MQRKIDKLIDKSHLRSDKQVVEYVQKRLPSASEQEILDRNDRKRNLRGKRRPKNIEAHYHYPVFSNHFGGYQIDLLEQSKEDGGAKKDKDDQATRAKQTVRTYPPFFFMAINTNTKYAYAYPMKGKTEAEVLRCLREWWADAKQKIVSIRCDAEASFDSREVNKWFKDHKISVKTITDQNHTSLSVVDRVIRTLRDMNTPTEKTKRTSMNRKYRDFTAKRMRKLLKIYNDTTHKQTKMKPNEMDGSEEDEKRYIIKKLYESERRHKLKDYTLETNMYVKYIVPRKDKEKHRYKVSPECYKIKGKNGHAYIIMAKDGSTLTLTRWRLIPVGTTIPRGMKFGRSINNAKHGIMVKILDHSGKQYKVEWQSPDKRQITTWEPVENFKRERKSKGKLTRLEREYWKGKNIPKGILS